MSATAARRLIPSLLAALFLFAACACGGNHPAPPEPEPPHYLADIVYSRWVKSTVTYRLVPMDGQSDVPTSLAAPVRVALLSWQPALDGLLTVREATADEIPDVFVFYLDEVPGGKQATVDFLFAERNPDKGIVGAVMKIRKGLDPFTMQSVAAHEWGHIAGIRGHSEDTSVLMYKAYRQDVSGPTPRDINTVRAIYSPR